MTEIVRHVSLPRTGRKWNPLARAVAIGAAAMACTLAARADIPGTTVTTLSLSASAKPWHITVGPDGNVWYIDEANRHEIAVNEPTKLIATLRDTTGSATSGQTYPNLFINNTGLAPDGTVASGPVTVQTSAVSARTGTTVGNTITTTIDRGQTANIGHTFQALGIDVTKEDTIIVTVAVISGSAAIEGLVSQVDGVTRDGAAFEMSRGDF